MKKTNFHSHTIYCHHSSNKTRDLIEKAIEEGFEIFGVSEHINLEHFTSSRPSQNEFDQFFNELKALREEHKNKIKIYIGIESECHPEVMDKIKRYYDFEDVDYIIFGNHIYDVINGKFKFLEPGLHDDLIEKQAQYVKLAGESGLFTYFCHPDQYLSSYRKWDEKAKELADVYIQTAIKYNMPLEVNINGYRDKMKNYQWYKYPSEIFWDYVSRTNAPVIIGVDSHDLDLMDNKYYEAIKKFVKDHNLEKNLVKELKLKKETVKLT